MLRLIIKKDFLEKGFCNTIFRIKCSLLISGLIDINILKAGTILVKLFIFTITIFLQLYLLKFSFVTII